MAESAAETRDNAWLARRMSEVATELDIRAASLEKHAAVMREQARILRSVDGPEDESQPRGSRA